MVELVRAGRNPDDLAREFEPSGHSIRAWVARADRHEGRRAEAPPGLAAAVTGRRFLAVHWDRSLPPREAAEKAGAPVAWTSIATMPIEPTRAR
jgi:hypothetical protein